MTVTVAQFRQVYTEFADANRYPNAMVGYWLSFAEKLTNTQRWGKLAGDGQMLWAAHQIVLERESVDASENGTPPGRSTGLINSKSVDKVSIGYDTGSAAELDAGHWNLTIYGARYIRLARMMGAGPIQLGIGCPPGPLSSANAWPGPWFANFPNPSDSGT